MKEGSLILTVNKRLSRHLLLRYDRAMIEAGLLAWETPLIMPIGSWAESLIGMERDGPPLLSPAGERALWRKAVSEDLPSTGGDILMRDGVAETSLEAYALINDYVVTLPDDIYLTKEALYLKRWISSYRDGLKRLGCMDRASWSGRVIMLIKEGALPLPERIILAGFDAFTPKEWMLINAVKRRGVEVKFWPGEPYDEGTDAAFKEAGMKKGPIDIRAFSDEREEVIQAARWARSVIRPGVTAGFIVPELGRYRDMIEEEFSSELDPVSAFPWERKEEVYNISLGRPLYDEPLVRSALDILSITNGQHDTGTLSSVLLSPSISSDEGEYLSLARLDALLKDENILKAGLSDIKARISGGNFKGLSSLALRLDVWIKDLAGNKRKRPPGWWARDFNALLNALGWGAPGGGLDAAEYQALDAWRGLLDAFSGLDDVVGGINRDSAVSHLKTLAKEQIHQSEAPESAIQVLGPLEAAGLYFDHIWIMGAHEDSLPSPPAPNPFIPVYIQKKYDLPHSSHERELEFSKRLLTRLFNGSLHLTASCPLKSDERERRPTRLLLPFGAVSMRPVRTMTARLKDAIAEQAALHLEDAPPDEDMPVTAKEMKLIKGGASILKEQSACPFRAFALFRLRAKGISEPELGLKPEEKGAVVHAALRDFWETVKGSARLKGIIEDNGLKGYIKASVDAALKTIKRRQPAAYIELERGRIERLLDEWLRLEAERGGFSVSETEARRDISVGGLDISVRIDRIDEIKGGGRLILDYKTGKGDRNDWLGGRPKEPQLLLYGLSGDFDAIAFASVNIKGVRFSGISKDPETLPGIQAFSKDRWRQNMEGVDSWEDLRKRWEDTLLSLAEGFMNGETRVDPNPNLKGNDQPCVYCDLTPLCRIFDGKSSLMEIKNNAEGL
ncbi:MAG: PD-(D/E)XK nuclease family protein [Deltaproteobacteria bacterium]|nr:PD-(D/E)XK nuclease family protein [Deltaproteobacteria bacterium]